MIYQNYELFNVEQVKPAQDGSFYLSRFPGEVVDALGDRDHPYGQYVGRFTTGCEIRFCMECSAAVTLSSWDADGKVEVYQGDYFKARYTIKQGVKTTIMLNFTDSLNEYDFKNTTGNRFDNQVWRIVFAHDACLMLHDVQAMPLITPPTKEQKPKTTLLCYGSSITHGAGATTFSTAYINVMGKMLGVDVLDKGMGGSCFCEKEMADYLGESQEWDALFLEVVINMLGVFEVEEIERRIDYLLSKVAPQRKPLIFVTPFLHFNNLPDGDVKMKEKLEKCKEITRRLYEKYRYDGFLYIDGLEVLTDLTGLTSDLIHPSDYGHFLMGQKLAQIIAQAKLF